MHVAWPRRGLIPAHPIPTGRIRQSPSHSALQSNSTSLPTTDRVPPLALRRLFLLPHTHSLQSLFYSLPSFLRLRPPVSRFSTNCIPPGGRTLEDLSRLAIFPISGCIFCHLHSDPALASRIQTNRQLWPDRTLSTPPRTSTALALRRVSPCVLHLNPVAPIFPICEIEGLSRRIFPPSQGKDPAPPLPILDGVVDGFELRRFLLAKTDSTRYLSRTPTQYTHSTPGSIRRPSSAVAVRRCWIPRVP